MVQNLSRLKDKAMSKDCFDCSHCHCGGYKCYFCDIEEHEWDVSSGHKCNDFEELSDEKD